MEGGRRIHGFVVHQEDLWAATSDGLFVFDSKTLRREKRALPEDLSGVPSALGSNGAALVVATDSAGLAVWENDSWDVLATGEEGLRRPVQALIADGGRVILGGAGWLEEWRLMGGFKDILAENPSLGKLIVSDLCLLDGILWVSTIGQGLLHRKDGRWDQLLPPFQDLGSSNLYSLTPTPEGQVLAAHSLGLSRIRVVSK
jgi:ligand-binding sensor domain-containing protein